ncbi:MAG TPA: hypothetical protein VF604_16830 [Pyrinomonadaceae bacterium]|jgi:hypothetical protein
MPLENLTAEIADFISLIKKIAKENNLSLDNAPYYIEEILYGAAGKSKSGQLSNIISGSKYGDISWFIALFAAINHGGEIPKAKDVNIRDVQKWLIYWLAGELEWDRKSKESKTRQKPFKYNEEYWNVWMDAARKLKESVKYADSSNKPTYTSKLPTLNYFPEAFEPLTIITGTGQAIPPDKISDIFRANIRLKDLLFLNQIPFSGKPLIVPDRLLVDMKLAERVKRFGRTNLLLIGGPKVNAVTRKFCKYGFFRFQFDEKEKQFQDLYDSLNDEETKNEFFPKPNYVKLFFRFLENPSSTPDENSFKNLVGNKETRNKLYQRAKELREKLGSQNERYEEIVDIFLPNGLIDPIRNNCHTPKSTFDRDNLLITIAPNLWNNDKDNESFEGYKGEYVSIIVAGIDVLGTCTGIKKLSESESFEARPLGGFLEADFGNSDLEYDKFFHSSCSWSNTLTPEYTIGEFIKSVEEKISIEEVIKKAGGEKSIEQTIGKEIGEGFAKIRETTDLNFYLKFLKNFSS